jgi:hypothetical protein
MKEAIFELSSGICIFFLAHVPEEEVAILEFRKFLLHQFKVFRFRQSFEAPF